jgi:hypothetical protein
MTFCVQRITLFQLKVEKVIASIIILLFVVLSTLAVIFSHAYLIRAPFTPVGNGPGYANELQIFIGVFISIIVVPLSLVNIAVFINAFRKPKAGNATTNIRPLLSDDLFGLTGLLLVYFICILASITLPPIWNFSTFSYWPVTSPYSLISSPHIKIFLDIVIYYGFILFLILTGILSAISPKLRRFLNKRILVPSSFSIWKYHPFPTGVSIGECLLMASFGALYVFWIYYWCFDYLRIRQQVKKIFFFFFL